MWKALSVKKIKMYSILFPHKAPDVLLHKFYRSYPQETVDYVNKCWKFIYSNPSVRADIQVIENIKRYTLSDLMNIGTSLNLNTSPQ